MRAGLAAICLTLASLFWATSGATAAEIQSEAALPSISGASVEAQVKTQSEQVTCLVEVTQAATFAQGGWQGASVVPCSLEPTMVPCPQASPGDPKECQRGSATISGLATDTEYQYRFI